MLTKIMIIIGCLLVFGAPVALGIVWGRKYHLPFWTFISGVLVYELFAYCFCHVLRSLLLSGTSSVSAVLNGTPWLYALCYGLTAGIPEELGRVFGFAVLLKRYKNKETAVAFGIGYSGIDGMLTVGTSYLIYVLFIFGYRFGYAEQDAAVLGNLAAVSAGVILLSMLERLSFLLLHLGLSVMVFSGVREKKTAARTLPAVLLHAAALFPTGLRQVKVLPNWAAVSLLFLVSALCFFIGYRIWNGMKSADGPERIH